MVTPPATRFDVTAITLTVAGEQTGIIDAHHTTRRGVAHQIVTVTLGDLAVYCLDLAVVCQFVDAWTTAPGYAPTDLPTTLTRVAHNRHAAGIILRVAGPQDRHHVHGLPAITSPYGTASVRVILGPLTVHALDLVAVTGWADTWQRALAVAQRTWPERDAFDLAEARDRDRIARHGAAALRRPTR